MGATRPHNPAVWGELGGASAPSRHRTKTTTKIRPQTQKFGQVPAVIESRTRLVFGTTALVVKLAKYRACQKNTSPSWKAPPDYHAPAILGGPCSVRAEISSRRTQNHFQNSPLPKNAIPQCLAPVGIIQISSHTKRLSLLDFRSGAQASRLCKAVDIMVRMGDVRAIKPVSKRPRRPCSLLLL